VIARFGILTPFLMAVPEGADFTVYGYNDSGYMVYVYPPMKSSEPIREDVPDSFEIGDKPGFMANALRIDFAKDDFDRSEGTMFDPPAEVIQRAVSSFLTRYRHVARAPQISPDLLPFATFRVQYLNDDGTELQPERGKVRARAARQLRFSYVALTPEIFANIHTLNPDWQPSRWQDLLLDAQGALPKVGTAVVLAATALEVFIADTLDALAAKSAVPPEMWKWLNKRKDIDNNPSTDEQFDSLLEFFVGKSLKKEDKALWDSFMNLRTARNKFVHEGAAKIGGVEIDAKKAGELVGKAREITAKIREWLPPEMQWPDFPQGTQISMEINLSDRLRGKPSQPPGDASGSGNARAEEP
jgi:hypothetical protein